MRAGVCGFSPVCENVPTTPGQSPWGTGRLPVCVCVVSKGKKLYNIKSVSIDGCFTGGGPGADSVVKDFEAKWCKNLHARDMLNNLFSDHSDAHIEFDSDEVSKAFQVGRNIRKLDSNGISIAVLKLISKSILNMLPKPSAC